MATSDMQLSQLHPGVYSRIQSTDDTYQISTGIITLLAADAFPKGRDNVIDSVGSVAEFIAKYGEPDFTKYGQQAYNISQWLTAGGQALVMRLLPDDATYAHAVLNIQSRYIQNGKSVYLQDSGETVKVDSLQLRPTAAFIQENNKNLQVLQNELLVDRGTNQNTVDGMRNNFILLVTPEGRGEFYNKLGFRMTPNGSYATSRNSQVYNFEVVEFNEDGTTDSVEGPFYVTFDPDAISGDAESMYIEDVINRHSQYLKVEFNYDAYKKLAKMVNPNVSPAQLELLSGSTMEDPNTGKSLTVFNPTTKRDEDIHLSIQKFNSQGRPVMDAGEQVMDIASPRDAVQSAIVKLDNQLRENDFDREKMKMSYMKSYFPMLRDSQFNQFKNQINNILMIGDGTKAVPDTGKLIDFLKANFNMGDTNSLYSLYSAARDSYAKTSAQSDLTSMLSAADDMIQATRSTFVEFATQLYAAYALVQHGSSQGTQEADYNLHLPMLLDRINQRDKVSILAVEHQKTIAELINKIQDSLLSTFDGSIIDNVDSILNTLDTEIQYLHDSMIPAVFGTEIPTTLSDRFVPGKEGSLVNKLAAAMSTLNDLQAGYLKETPSAPAYTVPILTASKQMANEIIDIISQINYQINKDTIDDADYGLYAVLDFDVASRSSKVPLISDLRNFAKGAMQSTTVTAIYTEENVRSTARQNIDNETSALYQQNSLFFNNTLLDFSNPVKLLMGSDGAFTYDVDALAARKTAINAQIIKAYKGQISETITNKSLFPADMVLDARYSVEVKNAITSFVRDLRQDLQFFSDTASSNFAVSATDAVDWRRSRFNVISEYVSLFTQDFTYYDSYNGRNIRFSPTFVLASKVPTIARQYGLQYPIAGPRRGIIDGFTDVSWYPDEASKESLYKARINYFQFDNQVTTLGTQSTTRNGAGALSQINNMFTILRLRRGAEQIARNFIMELNTTETISALYTALSAYTQQFIGDHSIADVRTQISSSDYDIQQRILRVSMSIKFNGVIERVGLEFNV